MLLRRHSALLYLIPVAAASCIRPAITGNPVLVDPTNVSAEIGSTEEIYDVSHRAVSEFLGCSRLSSEKNYKVVLDDIVNQTGYRNYDERIFYNRLRSELTKAAGQRFTFLDRRAVEAERSAQSEGEVAPTGYKGPLAGADLVLTVQLLTLRSRTTRTIQYNMTLTGLDGQILCTSTREFKKRT